MSRARPIAVSLTLFLLGLGYALGVLHSHHDHGDLASEHDCAACTIVHTAVAVTPAVTIPVATLTATPHRPATAIMVVASPFRASTASRAPPILPA